MERGASCCNIFLLREELEEKGRGKISGLIGYHGNIVCWKPPKRLTLYRILAAQGIIGLRESKQNHRNQTNIRNRQDPPLTIEELKIAQLAFREAEIMETIHLFHRLNDGEGEHIKNLKPHSPSASLHTFKNRLDLNAVTIAGHSYGATGTLQAIKSAPSSTHPLNGAIALDPGKESGPLNDDIEVPVLVFNSGEWTEKQVEFYGQGKHFDVERKLVKKADKGWFMTLRK